MKKIDLGQTISTLANIGVIAGIVFLAIEIQQNSEALGVQAQQNRQNVRRSIMVRTVDNPELARALYKAENGEDLTSFEQFILDQEAIFRIVNWEIVFSEVQEGLLGEDAIPLSGWKTTFHSWPGLPEQWERYLTIGPGVQNRDFVEFVNENIVEP